MPMQKFSEFLLNQHCLILSNASQLGTNRESLPCPAISPASPDFILRAATRAWRLLASLLLTQIRMLSI